jgi:hypothetical protein
VSADITFPSTAVTKSATAMIINNAGAPVSGVFQLNPVGGDTYVGTVSALPPGNNYKAKAFANWTFPPVSDGHDKVSTNTSTCPPMSPPPPPPPAPPVVADKKPRS